MIAMVRYVRLRRIKPEILSKTSSKTPPTSDNYKSITFHLPRVDSLQVIMDDHYYYYDDMLPADHVRPLPIPQPYSGRKDKECNFNHGVISSLQGLENILMELVESSGSPETSQRFGYSCAGNAFSVTWQSDIVPWFRQHLDLSKYNDYRSIRPYALRRCRLHMPVFERICKQLDQSRRTLGNLFELENEAAKSHYIHPILNTLLSLFRGRLLNMPEHNRKLDSFGNSGRCTSTISLLGQSVLLFVQCKDSLDGSPEGHSNLIAEIIEQAETEDLQNNACELGVPLHIILTDGERWEFYMVDFSNCQIFRGMGENLHHRIPFIDPYCLRLPTSDQDPAYLPQLKRILEIIFVTLLQAYINGCYSRKLMTLRCERDDAITKMASHVVPEHSASMGFWLGCYEHATMALYMFRTAHDEIGINLEPAEKCAAEGLAVLKQSTDCIPVDVDCSLLDNWETRRLELLRV